MADKNYMTREMDTTKEVAEEKDRLLTTLKETPEGMLYLKLISKANVVTIRAEDYIDEMNKAMHVERPRNAFTSTVPFWQITHKGLEFLKVGGYTEEWRTAVEKEISELKTKEQQEAARIQSDKEKFDLEKEKFKLEKRKFSLSKYAIWIAVGSFIFTGANFFYGLNKDSRINEIEKQLPAFRANDNLIIVRIDTIEKLVHDMGTDSIDD